jgi:hypothetical protein
MSPSRISLSSMRVSGVSACAFAGGVAAV